MVEFKRTILRELIASASSYPVVTVIGPRQSGKTTLVKMAFPDKPYISLEAPDSRQLAIEDPRRFLEQYPKGAILDEIQRTPTLLSYIQGIVDEQDKPGFFILTGSHQLSLQQGISQSLAGRTGLLHLMPLSLEELKQFPTERDIDHQLFYGFYPRIYKHTIAPERFYRDYLQTYIERDVRQIAHIKDQDQFQRFLALCASRLGQLLDYTHIANALGVSRHTVKTWIALLKASFVITTLPPYFENLGKRIVKSPKLYFTDVGLACHLVGIQHPDQVYHHPLRGNLFENLVVNEITKLLLNKGKLSQLYFYRDSNQLEVDLLFQYGIKLIAIEIKSSKTFTKGFLNGLIKFDQRIANHATANAQGYVVYSGEHQQRVGNYQVINYKNIATLLD